MLSNLLIASALFKGAVQGVKLGLNPPPPQPPEHISIWWCPECGRYQQQYDENPPVCFYHKRAEVMHSASYSHGDYRAS